MQQRIIEMNKPDGLKIPKLERGQKYGEKYFSCTASLASYHHQPLMKHYVSLHNRAGESEKWAKYIDNSPMTIRAITQYNPGKITAYFCGGKNQVTGESASANG